MHNYSTVVMGASFRNTGEILELAGCDRLTISPALMQELSESHEKVTRKLTLVEELVHSPAPLSESDFRWMLNEDAMATEKTAEGIRGFAADQVLLEKILAEKLA